MEPGWASLTYWGPFQGPGRSRWSKAGGREARMPPTGAGHSHREPSNTHHVFQHVPGLSPQLTHLSSHITPSGEDPRPTDRRALRGEGPALGRLCAAQTDVTLRRVRKHTLASSALWLQPHQTPRGCLNYRYLARAQRFWLKGPAVGPRRLYFGGAPQVILINSQCEKELLQ